MLLEARLESALRSAEPARALRSLVRDLSREGCTRSEIYEILGKFVLQRRERADGRESDEEMILDVMDALTDWCHPAARLFNEG